MAHIKRRWTSPAIGLSLSFHVLVLTGLALGARRFTPQLEDHSIEVSLIEISASPPKNVPLVRRRQRLVTPRPFQQRDRASPFSPIAAPPSPAEQRVESQEAQSSSRIDLGCYGISNDTSRRCEQQRWQPPAQNGQSSDIGPLARLGAAKQAALDSAAADQAACLEYKKHAGMDPPPWGLFDIFKKGLC